MRGRKWQGLSIRSGTGEYLPATAAPALRAQASLRERQPTTEHADGLADA